MLMTAQLSNQAEVPKHEAAFHFVLEDQEFEAKNLKGFRSRRKLVHQRLKNGIKSSKEESRGGQHYAQRLALREFISLRGIIGAAGEAVVEDPDEGMKPYSGAKLNRA